MELLDKALALLAGIDGTIIAGAGLLLETVFRLLPTKKPLSILHIVSGAARKLGDLLKAVADLLDKVLPQNTPEQ
jgi:hypothetical protein